MKCEELLKATAVSGIAMFSASATSADEPPLITRLNIPPGMTPPAAIPGHGPSVTEFYPESAKRCEERGAIKLEITIAADGHISDAKIIGSSGYVDLDAAARKAALTWIWAPAMQNGKPVAIRILATAMFQNRNPVPANCPPPPISVTP
jgi:TonB family protein